MNILLANVGRVRTNEIKVLAGALNKNHNVTVACMAADSSHRGLAFSFQEMPIRVGPLTYKEIIKNSSWVAYKDPDTVKSEKPDKPQLFDGIAAYEFFSNPADAVSIMLAEIMAHNKPDLVICGINNGHHMGQDIYHSSNVAMAMEASFFKVPSVAVGIEWQAGGHRESQLENAVKFIEKNAENFAKVKLPPYTFLNINIPTVDRYKQFKGVKISRMGSLNLLGEFEEKTDPKGVKYYWAKRQERADADEKEWARTWFDKGFITVVPINYDATDYDAVKNWEKGVLAQIRRQEMLAEIKGDLV
jgi:5'-nucleotidase